MTQNAFLKHHMVLNIRSIVCISIGPPNFNSLPPRGYAAIFLMVEELKPVQGIDVLSSICENAHGWLLCNPTEDMLTLSG